MIKYLCCLSIIIFTVYHAIFIPSCIHLDILLCLFMSAVTYCIIEPKPSVLLRFKDVIITTFAFNILLIIMDLCIGIIANRPNGLLELGHDIKPVNIWLCLPFLGISVNAILSVFNGRSKLLYIRQAINVLVIIYGFHIFNIIGAFLVVLGCIGLWTIKKQWDLKLSGGSPSLQN